MQYAREHHFPNPTFFVDDGVSGVTYDRPGFQAMLAEIEAGRVAVAIAKDLSRLGRNSALTGLYTNFTFPQNGVRFIAINDNYDTIDPNRVDNDFAGIKNWFNGNVKKCAVGKYPKSEKHGNTAQFSKVERSGTQENCGGIGSGCRLRLRPLPVLHRRQSQRVACIDPDAVVVDKNIAKNDRFDLFSR